MPEIKRFGGFKLVMFFQDENPPHVHIKGPDFAAKVHISNGDLLAGDAPDRRWFDHYDVIAGGPAWRAGPLRLLRDQRRRPAVRQGDRDGMRPYG